MCVCALTDTKTRCETPTPDLQDFRRLESSIEKAICLQSILHILELYAVETCQGDTRRAEIRADEQPGTVPCSCLGAASCFQACCQFPHGSLHGTDSRSVPRFPGLVELCNVDSKSSIPNEPSDPNVKGKGHLLVLAANISNLPPSICAMVLSSGLWMSSMYLTPANVGMRTAFCRKSVIEKLT